MTARAHALLLGIALAMVPAAASAQARCEVQPVNAPAQWQAPLGRTITLHLGDVALRAALARLESAAHIRISYSAEALPLERRVCLEYERVAVGEALARMLAGTNVHAVVAGADHIVLAPRAATPARESSDEIPVVQHEPVIAATSIPHVERSVPSSTTVITGAALQRSGARTLAQAMNGTVPGLWLWGHSASGLLAQYGSMRGASSFGGNAPKVYIDGIELANPLLLNRLSVDAIERIEIIRGPQGAALYGANAIGGVTNVITRHDVVPGGAARLSLQSGFGVSNSDFTTRSAFAQDHAVSLRAGSVNRSLGVNLSLGSLGEFAPDASARHIGADASGRLIGSRSTLTATLRFLAERAHAGVNPIVSDSLIDALRVPGYLSTTLDGPRSVQQVTGGVTASFQPGAHWTHTILAGIDGYSLDYDVQNAFSPRQPAPRTGAQAVGFSSTAQAVSSPGIADVTSAWRGTLRLSSARALQVGDVATGRLTLSAEHSMLQQREGTLEQGRANTGLSAQTEFAIDDRLFITGGVRFEHDGGITSAMRAAVLPMLGGSYVIDNGAARVKLRAAYGKAIRWPELPAAARARDPLRAAFRSVALGPEQQSGIEGGVDIDLGNTFTLQLTRFDQTALSLAQPADDDVDVGGGKHDARSRFAPQSVGRIANRGWEMLASVTHGRVSLAGSASLVDSRVSALSAGYAGELRAGDRMLGVPARTFSMTTAWNGDATRASFTAARATDWINYDLIALAATDSGGRTGTQLRDYWRGYDGVTHLRAALARELGRGLTLTLTGENLLDRQLGEPDNLTIVPGRTFSLGIRAAF